MKKQIHKTYSKFATELNDIVMCFESKGEKFENQDRNSLKLFNLDDKTINVKSFKIPNLINKIVYQYFRKSKARRSYEYACKLTTFGIGTPQPIAYYENNSLLGLLDSYYICEHIKYDLTYRELVTNPEYPDHENILRQFTKFTWQLHQKGIYFKDHSPGNTLIVKNKNGYNFFLVDLNRMSFFKLDFEARMKNLSRLTPKKEMVEIMSDEYAILSSNDFEKVFTRMWFYTHRFQEKFHQKKRLKQKYLGKK